MIALSLPSWLKRKPERLPTPEEASALRLKILRINWAREKNAQSLKAYLEAEKDEEKRREVCSIHLYSACAGIADSRHITDSDVPGIEYVRDSIIEDFREAWPIIHEVLASNRRAFGDAIAQNILVYKACARANNKATMLLVVERIFAIGTYFREILTQADRELAIKFFLGILAEKDSWGRVDVAWQYVLGVAKHFADQRTDPSGLTLDELGKLCDALVVKAPHHAKLVLQELVRYE